MKEFEVEEFLGNFYIIILYWTIGFPFVHKIGFLKNHAGFLKII